MTLIDVVTVDGGRRHIAQYTGDVPRVGEYVLAHGAWFQVASVSWFVTLGNPMAKVLVTPVSAPEGHAVDATL